VDSAIDCMISEREGDKKTTKPNGRGKLENPPSVRSVFSKIFVCKYVHKL